MAKVAFGRDFPGAALVPFGINCKMGQNGHRLYRSCLHAVLAECAWVSKRSMWGYLLLFHYLVICCSQPPPSPYATLNDFHGHRLFFSTMTLPRPYFWAYRFSGKHLGNLHTAIAKNKKGKRYVRSVFSCSSAEVFKTYHLPQYCRTYWVQL